MVRFKPLTIAAAISLLTTTQLRVDNRLIDFHACREAIVQGHKCFAVRFAGGMVVQHTCRFYLNRRAEDRRFLLQQTSFTANNAPLFSWHML